MVFNRAVAHSLLLLIGRCDNVHQKSNQNKNAPIQDLKIMNTDITPEIISDEQLEEVAGGLADVENNSCVALYQATAQINL